MKNANVQIKQKKWKIKNNRPEKKQNLPVKIFKHFYSKFK